MMGLTGEPESTWIGRVNDTEEQAQAKPEI